MRHKDNLFLCLHVTETFAQNTGMGRNTLISSFSPKLLVFNFHFLEGGVGN